MTARIRADPPPHRSRHFAALYAAAESHGHVVLHRFARQIDAATLEDLPRDVVVERLREILEAENPRALFCTIVFNRARSVLRKQKTREEKAPAVQEPGGSVPESERRAFHVSAAEIWLELPERTREMLQEFILCGDAERIARAYGTTAANLYQILSRLRSRARKRGL
jgi:DNA-directed RNA polymerase specialized sigma24 family protein